MAMPTNGNVHRENNDDLVELISFFRQIQMDISLFSGGIKPGCLSGFNVVLG